MRRVCFLCHGPVRFEGDVDVECPMCGPIGLWLVVNRAGVIMAVADPWGAIPSPRLLAALDQLQNAVATALAARLAASPWRP
jgi:hypothetical protein